MCFVIDTSVSTERDAIRQEIQKLISAGSNPYNYILVYTNDGKVLGFLFTSMYGNQRHILIVVISGHFRVKKNYCLFLIAVIFIKPFPLNNTQLF